MNWSKDDAFLKSPFRVEGITERSYIKPGQQLYTNEMIDSETGELMPLFTAPQHKITLHDSKSYTKLFTDAGDIVRDLSPSATKLCLYVAINMKVNWDIVCLHTADVCNWGGFSNSTFYRALGELLEKKVLARKLGSHLEYWVNPNVFYNGDRVRLLKYLKQRPD